jgi:hypothetical protein
LNLEYRSACGGSMPNLSPMFTNPISLFYDKRAGKTQEVAIDQY